MRIASYLAIVILALTTMLPAQRFEPTGRKMFDSLSPELKEVVTVWLALDCFVDHLGLQQRLTENRFLLEQVFWEAYELGPLPSSIKASHSTLAERYAARQRWLESRGREVLGHDVAAQLMRVPLEEFAAMEAADQARRYREAALGGLALVCSKTCEAPLARIADESSDLRSAAITALRSLQERLRPRD